MRVLGVDYGTRRIGVAVSDELGLGARGVTTLRDLRDRDAVSRLAALVEELEAEAVVVGLPVRADGSAGEAAERVRRFAGRLADAVAVPVMAKSLEMFWTTVKFTTTGPDTPGPAAWKCACVVPEGMLKTSTR